MDLMHNKLWALTIIDFLSKVEEKKINDIVVSKISESVFHLYKK